MGDSCADRPYLVRRAIGEGACPSFNSLYWTFLMDNEEVLRVTGRVGTFYSYVDDEDEDDEE